MHDEIKKLTPLGKAMARQMNLSWETPQFQVAMEISCTALMAARKTLAYKPSVTSVIVAAVAKALGDFPLLNASWGEDHIDLNSEIGLGVAMDTGKGLLVPVIHDAGSKSLLQIHENLEAMKTRTERGNFTMEELQGGTFTVSNLGMFGVSSFHAVVNAPQAAILALAAIREMPVVREGQLMTDKVMCVTLSVDHRVTDGATGARFLMRLKEILEAPEQLF